MRVRIDTDKNEDGAMNRVFIGGSRKISRLNSEIRSRLDGLLANGLDVVIGDANGADKAVQSYLASKGYKNVVLYCSGEECRNNVGEWPIRHIQTSSATKDFKHYSEKDKEMAREANYGLFLWDGASKGTLENIRRMLDQGKTSLVYLSDSRSFVTIRNREDFTSIPSVPKGPTTVRRRASRRSTMPQGTGWLL